MSYLCGDNTVPESIYKQSDQVKLKLSRENLLSEMVKIIFVAFLCLTIFCLAVSNPPEFNYDFTGFQQLTKLLPTNCDNITGQVTYKLITKRK